MALENDLGRDPIRSLVLRIALPSMLAQFVSVLYSIVDRIYIGNIPEIGDIALAGVGVCGPVVTMVGSVASLICLGGSPLIGMSLGQGNEERAKRILSNCLLMLLTAAAVLTAVILPLRRPMLYLFGASDVTYPYADAYFTVYISGTVFALLSTGLSQLILAQGFAKVSMRLVLLGAVLNIVLDPIFMFALGMGVPGAALATVLSQMGSAAYGLLFLLGKRTRLRLSFGGYRLSLMGHILAIGFSPFLIIAVDNIMIIAMNAVLQRYGGPEQGDMLVTVSTIVQSFMLVVTMPLGGISGGTQSILSFNFGAGNKERVLKAQREIGKLCVVPCSWPCSTGTGRWPTCPCGPSGCAPPPSSPWASSTRSWTASPPWARSASPSPCPSSASWCTLWRSSSSRCSWRPGTPFGRRRSPTSWPRRSAWRCTSSSSTRSWTGVPGTCRVRHWPSPRLDECRCL